MSKQFGNLKTNKLPGSEVEITGEISSDVLMQSRAKAVKNVTENIELPGFRKGKVPEGVLVQKVGEVTILEEAANIALNDLYSEILKDAKVEAIGDPSVTITKLARDNPLGFKIVVTVYPEFTLPKYTEIAKEENAKPEEISVTERDVEDVILEIRKHHAHMELHKKTDSENHDHAPIEEKDLPELTDELIKQFGNFENIDDFKKKINENVMNEKIIRAKEKKRIAIIEAIMDKTEVDVPNLLVQNELEKMLAQFKDDVARTGFSYDDYLKTVGKSEEEIKKDWNETALKKAKAQLVVGRIAESEKLTPDKEELERESKKLIDMHKDANPVRIKMYVATMLLNEKVFQFLENQKN